MANCVPPVYACDYSDQPEALSADGTVPVPNRPGLGVEPCMDVLGPPVAVIDG